jgi:membrane-associated phospholipid phosphatase
MTNPPSLPPLAPSRQAGIPIRPAILLTILAPVAALFDRSLATFVRDSGLADYLAQNWPHVLLLVRVPGNFWSYTIPACLWLLACGIKGDANLYLPVADKIKVRVTFNVRKTAYAAAGVCTTLNIASTLRLPNNALWTSALTLALPNSALWTYLAAAATVATALWLLIPGHVDRQRLQQAAVVLLAGILSGTNWLLKWCIGRTRPFRQGTTPFEFHPFDGGMHGLGGHPPRPFSFPSGDVSLAFAMLAALGWVAPRYRPLLWALALIVLIERLAENAHYLSDTIGGAALGWASAWAAVCLVQRALGRRNPLELLSCRRIISKS